MSDKYELYLGYNTSFLAPDTINLPALSDKQQQDIAPVANAADYVARYMNYSLIISKKRKFPYFTASNIDGEKFKKVVRDDNWRKDDRLSPDHQWGNELYKAPKSDFDKGHMTKREDTQWGDTMALAQLAADSTFHYTNAVPQHALLNQRIWRSLEDYILHTETVDNGLKINVFTGPVLDKKDPLFISPVKGENVPIPYLFWKIVYFRKSDGKLYRVGFLMSQYSLLFDNGIVKEPLVEIMRSVEDENLFMQFKDADTYQVSVSTIEKLSKLTFTPAIEPFTDDRKISLIIKEVDVKKLTRESANPIVQLGFSIVGLEL